jgi:hypothetical protein
MATAMTKIAVDSKYWLWVNGQLVVREGGLKRILILKIPIMTMLI